ncbi:hypothetical protein B0T10DRAFT_588493 [Thelonectria olida]|uniref:Uncharacterized protein n=1 Tax=Thelonectria olida TaxID=1576542 RepID=A0A9P8VRU5_9HYPO|nr:hypothetical protein B0T10DRAFT_588493 [Thelonectria olida]
MTTNTDAEVEVACGSQEEDPRPKDSPYSSPLVHVLFDSGREFLVPKDILCKKIPSLPVVDVWMPTPGNCKTCRGPRGPGGFEKQAKLGHLSQEVGHILIHYLFTNEYESLQPSGESLEEKQESEFVTAIQAADAAQIYKLPTLANLAVMEIRRLGDKLSFLRLVDLIEQTSKQILHQPDVLAYVDCRIQALCNDLTASLADELLFELGTPTTVSRALFKSLIGLRKKDLATEKYRVQLGSEDEESSGGDCDLKPASCTSSLVFPKMNHVPGE